MPETDAEPASSLADAALALERELAHEAFASDPRALLDHLDERLSGAIRSLSQTEREAFLLRALGELEYREIADVCGIPIGTVMSRIFRAREKLRVQLGVRESGGESDPGGAAGGPRPSKSRADSSAGELP